MMRASLIASCVMACSGSSGAVDAYTDPLVCKANLEAAIDRACGVPADCALAASEDCCGTVMIGIANTPGNVSAFATAELTYGACLACGARGCAHADYAEEGGAPMAGQAIVATCVSSRCKAILQ